MPIYLNNAKVEQVRTGVTPSPTGCPPLAPTADGAVGTSTDYARADHQHPAELPSGGSTGQVLTKTASGEEWADAPSDASLAATVAVLQKDLGSVGHNCRAIAGSYTGAGTYGAANKITLQTDFTPLLVLITNPGESANLHLLVWLRGMAAGDNGYSGRTVTLEWGEHSVAWYSTVSGVNGPEYLHLNVAGYTYRYVVLGY